MQRNAINAPLSALLVAATLGFVGGNTAYADFPCETWPCGGGGGHLCQKSETDDYGVTKTATRWCLEGQPCVYVFVYDDDGHILSATAYCGVYLP